MDLGTLSAIPVEVIEKIFSLLSWDDLTKCSEASEGLRPLALGIREKYAQRHCEQDFGSAVCHDAKRKSLLSWSELHHSMSLWPSVKLARMNIKASDPLEEHYSSGWEDEIKKLQILKGGVLGYAHNIVYNDDGSYSIAEVRSFMATANAVVYYDSATLKEIRLYESDFKFTFYEENDYLMVLKETKESDRDHGSWMVLHVHSKQSDKIHKLRMYERFTYEPDKPNFFIVQKKLFYISDRVLFMAKEVTNNGETQMDVSRIEFFNVFKKIISIVNVNDDQVYILTYNGNVFTVIDKNVEFLRNVAIRNTDRAEAVNTLTDYGFKWSDHSVYKWIGAPEFRNGKWIGLTHLKNATVFSYGKVVIIGTCHRTLHIYINPYKKGLLRLLNRRPTVNIDLRLYEPCQIDEERMVSHHRKIIQIDVVEIKNGHRIVMLHCQKIVTVEFTHH